MHSSPPSSLLLSSPVLHMKHVFGPSISLDCTPISSAFFLPSDHQFFQIVIFPPHNVTQESQYSAYVYRLKSFGISYLRWNRSIGLFRGLFSFHWRISTSADWSLCTNIFSMQGMTPILKLFSFYVAQWFDFFVRIHWSRIQLLRSCAWSMKTCNFYFKASNWCSTGSNVALISQ